jgi:signal transduction histidine kinase
MKLRNQFRFPWVDASILLVVLLIGWASLRLAKLEPQIAGDRQLSQELTESFKQCQDLFRDSIEKPERARREFDLVWQEAATLKSEYLNIADHLQSDLPELDNALRDVALRKDRGDLQERMRKLKSWIAKQRNRADLERLDVRSAALMEQTAAAQSPSTNRPNGHVSDLRTLLEEIDRAYEIYLAEFREITNNASKPLVETFIAQRLEGARKSVAQISELADQARRKAKGIEVFLQAQTSSAAVKRTSRQQEIIQAFLEAGSPAEFARRIGGGTPANTGSSPASAFKVPSFQQVQIGLLVALAGLGIFLIFDLYLRTVVMPLRIKLVQRETIIAHQEKLANFEQMAAGLAHEIRNPLTAINARLYTVQRKFPEGSPEHKDTVVIRDEIGRVNQILKDFIQLTRPAAPNLAPMNAEPLLKEIGELMAVQLHRQAVRLERQSQGQARFNGDAQQLKQVLINLIQNAAQSIGKDGLITLRSRDGSATLKGTQTKVAIIEVEDNGPGIRPEVQGRLFDPFFSTRKGGTGLGLPISARIMDRHGGRLDFETEAGQRTVFRMTLPAYEED